MTPVEKILEKLHMNESALAKALGVHYTTVYRWSWPHDRTNATFGHIPTRYHKKILEVAHEHKVKIKAEDFMGL